MLLNGIQCTGIKQQFHNQQVTAVEERPETVPKDNIAETKANEMGLKNTPDIHKYTNPADIHTYVPFRCLKRNLVISK